MNESYTTFISHHLLLDINICLLCFRDSSGNRNSSRFYFRWNTAWRTSKSRTSTSWFCWIHIIWHTWKKGKKSYIVACKSCVPDVGSSYFLLFLFILLTPEYGLLRTTFSQQLLWELSQVDLPNFFSESSCCFCSKKHYLKQCIESF
jgi:hypothetical protein